MALQLEEEKEGNFMALANNPLFYMAIGHHALSLSWSDYKALEFQEDN